MKLTQYLPPEHILMDVPLTNKDAVLQFIGDTFAQLGLAKNGDKMFEALKTREAMMSTGIGGGIGIPHALTSEVADLSMLFIKLRRPIPFDALDGQPVDVVIALAVPENETTLHLRALACISGLCRRPDFLSVVRQSHEPSSVEQAIIKAEEQ